MKIALASEWDRLSPTQRSQVCWIIIDDGTWTEAEIEDYIERHFGTTEIEIHPEDWTKP
jgi:hypothetical protein